MPTHEIVLSFEEARRVVEQHASAVAPRGTEEVPLLEANGRVLAETITADRDFPPFRRATRDGYALRSADLRKVPATLHMVAEIKAGASPVAGAIKIASGQAASIMTGAPAPDGADAVVMIEYTSRAGDKVVVERAVSPQENIVPAGAEGRAGDVLLAPGVRIDHSRIAVTASVGKAQLTVFRRPRIAVLATGDEVVDITAVPGPSQIRNSNSYSLAAQVGAAGGEPVLLPVAPDEAKGLAPLLEQGLSADLLLLAGGVSMGKYDLVEQVLEEFEAEFFFTGAKIQPGKPVVFGRARVPREISAAPVYFLGLPGNPVSTMVTFDLFAKPMVQALAGMAPESLVFLSAQLTREIKTKTGLTRFLPAKLAGEFGDARVELAPWEGSGDIAATARANSYIVIPPDRDRIAAGEWVPVMLRQ